MEVKAITKRVRISASKVRSVTRNIQGMPALAALDVLFFMPQKAARLLRKTLQSAVANAENNFSLNPADLIVKSAVVGEGLTLKRFRPRARGSANLIRKRTSHIYVTLAAKADDQAEEKGAAGAGKKRSNGRSVGTKRDS